MSHATQETFPIPLCDGNYAWVPYKDILDVKAISAETAEFLPLDKQNARSVVQTTQGRFIDSKASADDLRTYLTSWRSQQPNVVKADVRKQVLAELAIKPHPALQLRTLLPVRAPSGQHFFVPLDQIARISSEPDPLGGGPSLVRALVRLHNGEALASGEEAGDLATRYSALLRGDTSFADPAPPAGPDGPPPAEPAV